MLLLFIMVLLNQSDFVILFELYTRVLTYGIRVQLNSTQLNS